MTQTAITELNEIEEKFSVPVQSAPDKFFDTSDFKRDLKGKSIRSGAVTMGAQGIMFFLRLGSTMVLARLLAPADYGLVVMVSAFISFADLFKDLGLSTATIQRANINQDQISTLFWINAAVGFLLALVLAVMSPIISWFYSEPRITWITLALAGTFIFSGLTVQHQALLRRQMRFTALAAVEIGSMGIGIATGIAMAWYGVGYWALVGLSAATAISYMALVWVFCRWRPGLPVRQAGIRSMVTFGGHLTGFSIVNYFARNFDGILLGRFWGADVLGLYSRAYNIMMLPINQVRGPLNAVALPALSHIQNDSLRYKKYYIKLVTLLAFITMPLMIFLFVCADEVIALLLGSKWSGATGIFKILCINALIQPALGTVGLVLISLGQSKRYFTIGAINSTIAVLSFVVGLPWGAIGVAVAYTIATYVLLVPTLWYSFRQSPISIRDFFSAILRPVIASIIMGFVILAVRSYLTNTLDIASVGYSFIIGFMTYLMVLLVVPGGLLFLQELYSYRSFLFQKST